MNYIKQKRFSPKTPQPQQSHNPKQKARHSRRVTGLELIVGIEQFQNAYTSILTAVLASLFASFYFKKSLSRTLFTTSSIVGHVVLYIFKHTPDVPSRRNTFQWFFFSSTVNSFSFLTIYNDIASYNILPYYSTTS